MRCVRTRALPRDAFSLNPCPEWGGPSRNTPCDGGTPSPHYPPRSATGGGRVTLRRDRQSRPYDNRHSTTDILAFGEGHSDRTIAFECNRWQSIVSYPCLALSSLHESVFGRGRSYLSNVSETIGIIGVKLLPLLPVLPMSNSNGQLEQLNCGGATTELPHYPTTALPNYRTISLRVTRQRNAGEVGEGTAKARAIR